MVLRGSSWLTPRDTSATATAIFPSSEPLDGGRHPSGPMSISLVNLHPPPADLQRLVRDGLRRSLRQLPAWMLYDAEGSRLFAEICLQPEYTLTQREIALLEENAAAIAAAAGPGLVVEFGIGNARKVDPLLTALGSSVFAALDVSLSALKEALSGLAARHPNTAMVGICCDHTRLEQLRASAWTVATHRLLSW